MTATTLTYDSNFIQDGVYCSLTLIILTDNSTYFLLCLPKPARFVITL